MSDPIIRMSDANIRTFHPIVRYFEAAISTSDSKVSMFGPAMNWIAPILLIFTAGMRITGTPQLAFALTRNERKRGNP